MYEDIRQIEKNFQMSDFPLNVIVEPGNFCNLNCTTCANNRLTRPKGQMNILLYKKIIDEIAEKNPYTRVWLDFYGEPLLQKFKIYYMVDYARKQGLKNIEMNTQIILIAFPCNKIKSRLHPRAAPLSPYKIIFDVILRINTDMISS